RLRVQARALHQGDASRPAGQYCSGPRVRGPGRHAPGPLAGPPTDGLTSTDGVGAHARRIDDSPTRRCQTPGRGEVCQEPAPVESLPAATGSATEVDGAALPRLGQ